MTINQLRLAELREDHRHNLMGEQVQREELAVKQFNAQTDASNARTNALNAQTRIQELEQERTDDYRTWSAQMTRNYIDSQNVDSQIALRDQNIIESEADVELTEAKTDIARWQAVTEEIKSEAAYVEYSYMRDKMEQELEQMYWKNEINEVAYNSALLELDRFEATDNWFTRFTEILGIRDSGKILDSVLKYMK